MVYGLLGLCGLLLVMQALSVKVFLSLHRDQMQQHREERRTWEVERERLLNRAMTKEWETYVQMQSAQVVLPSTSDEAPRGMSDDEELRRIGRAEVEADGLGETLVELDDHDRELFSEG